MKQPLISPKPFQEYSPEEYHRYVSEMYELRQKGSKPKVAKVAAGISLSLTKKGKLSIRCSRKFKYITDAEMAALAKEKELPINQIWLAFKAKDFIMTKTKEEAQRIAADIGSIPW